MQQFKKRASLLAKQLGGTILYDFRVEVVVPAINNT